MFQREQLQTNDHLDFGGKQDYDQQPMINYYHNKQSKQQSQPKKLVNFKDAQQQKNKNIQSKNSKVRPMTAQIIQPQDKPSWDGHQVIQTSLFDKGIQKNELFKNEKKNNNIPRNVSQDKENVKNIQKLQNKQDQISQSFKTLNEIEQLIVKQRDQKSEVQLKKQQKELDQLQWMVQQEKHLKEEQDKEFKDKLTKLKQNEQITNKLGKQLQKGKRNHFQNSTGKSIKLNDSPYKKLSSPKKSGQKTNKSKNQQDKPDGEQEQSNDEYSDMDGDVWKNTLDVIEFQEAKGKQNNLLPGQYNDLDQIPIRGRKPHSQEKERRSNSLRELKPAQSVQENELLRKQMLDIQKRELLRQAELDILIKKQDEQEKSGSKQNTKQFNHLSKKLSKLQQKFGPLISKMDLPESKSQYPFTGHLLARTISKLIQSNSEQLGELIIDGILIEMVGVLNEQEQKQQVLTNQQRQKETINDFIEAFKDLAYDQDQIQARKLQSPTFQLDQQPQQIQDDQKYIPLIQLEKDQNFFKNSDDRIRYIETSSGFIIKVLENRKKRLNQTRKTSLYAPKNVEVFNNVCSDIMDNLLDDAATHMEKYTDQLAEQIFRNEFK